MAWLARVGQVEGDAGEPAGRVEVSQVMAVGLVGPVGAELEFVAAESSRQIGLGDRQIEEAGNLRCAVQHPVGEVSARVARLGDVDRDHALVAL